MIDRDKTDAKARVFFDQLWSNGDPWDLETHPFAREPSRTNSESLARAGLLSAEPSVEEHRAYCNRRAELAS